MNDAHSTAQTPETLGDFRLADLSVFPAAGCIEGPGGKEQVDPKVMAVLQLLAQNAGELVSRETLLNSIWEGRIVSDDVISRCIYQLRRHLQRAAGHGARRKIVRTLPKRGYLLDAAVLPLDRAPAAPDTSRQRHIRVAAAIAVLALVALSWWGAERSEIDSIPTAAATTMPTVAVLPFTDLSETGDQAYLADGISEEIIVRLATYNELRVIGRTSSFALRNSGYGSREISDLLGAQYLLEGSVRKEGNALRISAQLVDRDGVHLWGETFDRELQDVFVIQREIAQVTATSILPEVAPAESGLRQPNVEAYREYLVGKELLARRTGMYFDEAPEHFSRAIEIDPEFADAYAARAIGLFFRSRTVGRHDEQIEQALRDVERALELDPELGQAYAAKALLMERIEPTNIQEREALLRRALELDPAQPSAWNWLSGALNEQNRNDEAKEAMLQGLQIDPLDTIININMAAHDSRMGRAADGALRLERLMRLPNPPHEAARDLVNIYLGSSRYADALSVAKRLVLDASPNEGRVAWTFPLIDVYTRIGMHEAARYWVDREGFESPPSYFPITLFILNIARSALGYEETLARYHAVLDRAGVEVAHLPTNQRGNYGVMLSLAGNHTQAITELESLFESSVRLGGFWHDIDARLALAWSWQQTGQSAQAATLLQELAAYFSAQHERGMLQFGPDLAVATLNAAMLGDMVTARRYLEQAVSAGWLSDYGIMLDPRWDAARADDVLGGLLQQTSSSLELQRGEIAATDAQDEFVAQVDAVIAAGRGREHGL